MLVIRAWSKKFPRVRPSIIRYISLAIPSTVVYLDRWKLHKRTIRRWRNRYGLPVHWLYPDHRSMPYHRKTHECWSTAYYHPAPGEGYVYAVMISSSNRRMPLSDVQCVIRCMPNIIRTLCSLKLVHTTYSELRIVTVVLKNLPIRLEGVYMWVARAWKSRSWCWIKAYSDI